MTLDETPRLSVRCALWLEGFKNLPEFDEFLRAGGDGDLRIAISVSAYGEDHILCIQKVEEDTCAAEKTQ